MRRGAPSKYDPKNTPRLAGWLARDGKIDDEIADALGITRSTLAEWKKKYPELSDALRKNKDVVDRQVEDSLLKRAMGYDYEKTELEVHVVGDKEFKKKKVIQMHVSPDPVSCIFWLKNRKPDAWRADIKTLDFEKGKGEINQLFDQMKKEAPVAAST